MQKKNILIFLSVLFLYACSKSSSNNCPASTGIPSAAEVASVKTYLTGKGITATEDSRGFFYNIIAPGYGANFPNLSSRLTVNYKGTYTSGVVFDSTAAGSPTQFNLSGVILGWQYGMPLVKKAGVIDLYLPPTLAYGCAGSGTVPGNSILIFRVELLDY